MWAAWLMLAVLWAGEEPPVPDAPLVPPPDAVEAPAPLPPEPAPGTAPLPHEGATLPAPAPVVEQDEDEPPSVARGVVAAVGGGAAALAVLQVTGLTATACTSAGLLLTLLPVALDASPFSCIMVLCGLAPAQCLLLGTLQLAGALVAGPVAYLAARQWGGRRIPLVPVLAAVGVPSVASLAVGAFLSVAGTLANGVCLCVSFGWFTNYLMTRWGWGQQEAEYYAQRRAGPAVFYGMFVATQLVVLLGLAAGNAAALALLGWVTVAAGRENQPEDPVTPDWLTVDELAAE
ncbi:MAG: hypothetical protein HY904_03160 [Deltaproteobacteria bacterium]|nr:hypothetical protein [Deltaproteobacteria bacterium]